MLAFSEAKHKKEHLIFQLHVGLKQKLVYSSGKDRHKNVASLSILLAVCVYLYELVSSFLTLRDTSFSVGPAEERKRREGKGDVWCVWCVCMCVQKGKQALKMPIIHTYINSSILSTKPPVLQTLGPISL